jgi:2-polyprenyl-3-methyl-5-hydroxy-6-metoxy-1,4-benzoquinol methylase
MTDPSPAVPQRALQDLARALAKECRGGTAILGRGQPQLCRRLESGKHQASLCASGSLEDVAGAAAGTAGFDTVVLCRALEYEEQERARATLRDAWRLVRPQGRLVACVPNEDLLDDPEIVQRFSQSSLKRLLLTIDRPRLVSTQPLRWLIMTIDTNQPPSRAAQGRYAIMARLCRGSVLELGCGPGHLCKAIADRNLPVSGVDKNAGKIAKARELYPEIPFTEGDILTLSGEQRYDTVVLAEVLEHVAADAGQRMLARAWELVGPGGRLVVSVPNEDCVPHRNHLQQFDRKRLAALLRPLGRPRTVADQPFKWLLMYVDR